MQDILLIPSVDNAVCTCGFMGFLQTDGVSSPLAETPSKSFCLPSATLNKKQQHYYFNFNSMMFLVNSAVSWEKHH